MICSKAEFERFKKVQESGKINMVDMQRGAYLAHLSLEEYKDIFYNYKQYIEKYGKSSN